MYVAEIKRENGTHWISGRVVRERFNEAAVWLNVGFDRDATQSVASVAPGSYDMEWKPIKLPSVS